MSSMLGLAAPPQHDTLPEFASIDFTPAVRIAEFLAASRFWLIVVFPILLSNWVMLNNPSFFRWQVPTIIFLYLLASSLEWHPNQTILSLCTWSLIVMASMLAPLSLLAFVASMKTDFTVTLLLPISAVVLFVWICWRTIKRREDMSDQPDPANFITLGLGGIAPPVVTPTFREAWLSGGYRSILLLAYLWLGSTEIMGAKAMPSCFYLAAAIGSVAVIPWSLIPLRKALSDDAGVALLQTLARNRRTKRQSAYWLFVLRHTFASPRAFIWLAIAILFLGLASTFYVAGVGIFFLEVVSTTLRGFAPTIALGLACCAFVAHRRSRQYAMQHAAERAVTATVDYTLYLRSFIDDRVEVLRDGMFFRVWFVDPLFNAIRLLRFEEILVPSVWPFGQVLALGRPGDVMPEPGALRLAPSPSEVQWQERVRSLIANARLILMTVGFTSGLKWEFQQLIRSDDSRKLSLILPPDSIESMLSTWREFSSDSALWFSCPEDVLTRTIAIRFSGDRELPIFLIAQSPSTCAFRLALQACWLQPDVLLHREAESVAEARRRPLRSAAWVAAFTICVLLLLAFGSFWPATAMDQLRLTIFPRAVAGDPHAMYEMGISYEKQENPNFWRARQWLLNAAAAGDFTAMEHLGELLERGEGVPQSLRRAKKWYKEASEAGSYSASRHLRILLAGEKVLSLNKAATAGDASAMFKLGRLYSDGTDVDQNYDLAKLWYQKAAENGNAAAMFKLGLLSEQVRRSDYNQAPSWYEKAAARGYAKAAFNLGTMYEQGRGVPQDFELARRWYEKAAILGDPEAMLNLAVLHETGRGGPVDYKQARFFYESSIHTEEKICELRPSDCRPAPNSIVFRQLGLTPYEEPPEEAADAQELRQDVYAATVAMNNLGTLYSRGLGVQRDYAEAARWFGKSADKRYAPAMVNLAVLWQKSDDYEARLWLEQAAALGSVQAQQRLLDLQLRHESSAAQ